MGGDEKLRTIAEIIEDFWYRLKWFVKDDIVKLLSWAKVIILGGLMIGYFAIKELFEKKKRKEV